ncbi:HAMP domain-containing protein [Paenibacillus anaericanus]|uniref:HAMP domain-containing protein n=1 Tax=Paenibacillus anaericanus TaxID=170367 RepID=A0A3S1DMK0_9BACL|nr:histidine kinase [Paenibacillus anaericanus]RUT41423.1 HAMP domain-containing protein [Paenibacillus anaericanus]
MINLIKKKFNDIKFRNKLLLSHLLIALIPIILLGLLSFFQSYKIQMKELKSEAESSINQASNILDYKINRYNMLCEFMVLDRDFSGVFIKDYENKYFNMYLDFRDIMDPMVSQIKFMDDDIEEITFYTSGDLLGIRGNILPLSELKNKPWYDGFRGRHWVVYDEKVYLVQELISNLKDSNFMVISINYESLFSETAKLSDYIFVNIINQKENIIYSENRLGFNESLTQDEFSEYPIKIERKLDNIGWTINYFISNSNAYVNAMTIFKITLFVIFLSLIITFFLIYVFSNNFTRRIIRLKDKVDKVEQNNLDIMIQSTSKDEFGELTNGIGRMLERINSLILQVYQAEISKKESEYNKLISQINPHFLYNTLSFINWRALNKKDIETSYMVTTLGKFYRTTLNKGKNKVTIETEIEHIKAYLDLQYVMSEGRFEVDYSIDNHILKHYIIHFILQPIVENAIKHGFVGPDSQDNHIIISAHMVNDEIKIMVSDNGVGMSIQQQTQLLSTDHGGCGVKNVNDRIKLYYGNNYGLEIESQVNVGTKVVITLPFF